MSDTEVITDPNANVKLRSDVPGWTSWNRYSESMLRTLEKRILEVVKTAYRGFYVDIGPVVSSADKIWTISFNTESTKTPLVLLHGLGAGVALWCQNLDSLAANRPVYAMDLLGFGRSSRPVFSSDATEAEAQFVRSVEEWRREVKLEKFILLGHSLGGFLATSYAISHPDRVEHVILADPWGFPEPKPDRKKKDIPLWAKAIAYSVRYFNPLTGIRIAGPFGPWMINAVRRDIAQKYADCLNEYNTLIPQYIYQCNAQTPSGESAFHTMMYVFGWAKNPMEHRIDKLREDIPITLMYGSRSWLDHSAAEIIKDKRINSYVKIQVVAGAGHHVYADKPAAFNQYVNEACDLTDSNKVAVITKPAQNGIDKVESADSKLTKSDNKPLPVTE